MSYRDPYNDRMTNQTDPMYPAALRDAGWGRGGVIGAIVAIVLVAALIAYGTSRTPTNTATGPNTTTSEPSTTGQGGAAPAGAPSGVAR